MKLKIVTVLMMALIPGYVFAGAYEYRVPITGNASDSQVTALQNYKSLCLNMENIFNVSQLKKYLSSTSCEQGQDIGGHYNYEYSGDFVVEFNRPMQMDNLKLQSHYFDTESLARSEWSEECQKWQKHNKPFLISTCGSPIVNKSSNKVTVFSEALRVKTERVEYRQNNYCYCEELQIMKKPESMSCSEGNGHHNSYNVYETQDGYSYFNHYRKYEYSGCGSSYNYYTNYRLMFLNDQGYYQPLHTYQYLLDCEDAMNTIAKCSEE